VSNSSSSSFVIVGFLTEDTKETREKMLRHIHGDAFVIPDENELYDVWHDTFGIGNGDTTILSGSDNGIEDGKLLIGRVIADNLNDGGMHYTENNFEDIADLVKDVQKSTGLTGSIKIVTGTRYC